MSQVIKIAGIQPNNKGKKADGTNYSTEHVKLVLEVEYTSDSVKSIFLGNSFASEPSTHIEMLHKDVLKAKTDELRERTGDDEAQIETGMLLSEVFGVELALEKTDITTEEFEALDEKEQLNYYPKFYWTKDEKGNKLKKVLCTKNGEQIYRTQKLVRAEDFDGNKTIESDKVTEQAQIVA